MPRQLLPEEEQMQALEQQMQQRYGALGALEKGGDRNAIMSQFGLNAPNEQGLLDEFQRRNRGAYSGAQGLGGHDFLTHAQTGGNETLRQGLLTQLRDQLGYGQGDLVGGLRGQIQGLSTQQQGLREQAIDKRLGMAQQAEQGALSGLEQRGKEYQSAIDEQLQRMLGQTEYQAGQARQAVGSNLAERGLLRSSFGDQTLGEVGAQEVGQKAQQRVQAAQEQGLAQQGVDRTKQQIARKREMLATNRDLSQLQAFEDVGFNLDVDNLNQGVQQQMNQMELDARQQNAFGQIIGGLFSGLGAIGGFALGGPAGAAIVGAARR